jgi:hypothetical protein
VDAAPVHPKSVQVVFIVDWWLYPSEIQDIDKMVTPSGSKYFGTYSSSVVSGQGEHMNCAYITYELCIQTHHFPIRSSPFSSEIEVTG